MLVSTQHFLRGGWPAANSPELSAAPAHHQQIAARLLKTNTRKPRKSVTSAIEVATVFQALLSDGGHCWPCEAVPRDIWNRQPVLLPLLIDPVGRQCPI